MHRAMRVLFAVICIAITVGCSSSEGPTAPPLRVVAYNVYWHQHGIDRVAATIQALRPDIVLLSEVPPRDVPHLAQKLALRGPDGELNFYVTPNNPNEWSLPSTAIISRFPLRNAHPIPNPGGRDFAVMADVIVGGTTCSVVAVHLTATRGITPDALRQSDGDRAKELAALHREWSGRGQPAMIVGGDFNQLASGPNYRRMKTHLVDALAALGKTDWTCKHSIFQTRVDYVLTTPDWRPIAGGVGSSDSSDHRPIWLETALQR